MFTKLVDMELDDEDKMDTAMPISMPSAPDYPYGLRICLSEKELEKLGLPVPGVGDYLDLRAFACVTSVSCDSTSSGDRCRVELQIEKIAIEDSD
jgi:hypothetical protein